MTDKPLRPAEVASVALILAVAVIGVVAFFSVDVCNDEVTQTGSVVSVCRHLEVSDPPVAVLGLVLLGALGVFFTEVSGFGISLKREVQAAKTTAEAAKSAVETVREDTGDLAEGVRHVLTQSGTEVPNGALTGSNTLRELTNAYNTIRWTMPSGAKRTAAMGAVFQQMVEELRNVQDFDVASSLESDDRGVRLAAYAYLYSHPEPDKTSHLASALATEDKPFNQYWGLKAMMEMIKRDPHGLDPQSKRLLVEMLRDVGPSTDRGRLLHDILGS